MSGQVIWGATCEALGDQLLSVTVNGGDPISLTIPACSPVPTTTTTTAGATTTISPATTVKKPPTTVKK